VAAGAGCGYAPVRSQPASGVRVAPVRNDTAQAEVGGLLAAELRSELINRKQLESDSSSAPELHAQVVSLLSTPTSAGLTSAATYRINAELRFKIGEWEDGISAGEDYLAGVDVIGTEANRRAALRRLFHSIAKDAIDRYDVAGRLK
jgi:hypothetical protein